MFFPTIILAEVQKFSYISMQLAEISPLENFVVYMQ